MDKKRRLKGPIEKHIYRTNESQGSEYAQFVYTLGTLNKSSNAVKLKILFVSFIQFQIYVKIHLFTLMCVLLWTTTDFTVIRSALDE